MFEYRYEVKLRGSLRYPTTECNLTYELINQFVDHVFQAEPAYKGHAHVQTLGYSGNIGDFLTLVVI